MYLKNILTICILLTTSGCATTPETSLATIRFADPAVAGSVPGSFREIDRKPVPRNPEEIKVAPGKHTIGYACPNTILLDGPLRADGQFESGVAYLLRCTQDGGATFEEQ